MIELNFKPFPQLETGRLVLRNMVIDDAPEIFFLRSDNDVMRYIDREPAKTIKDAEDLINKITTDINANEAVMWAISLKEDPKKLIGTICLWHFQKEHFRGETGYMLHPLHWRKGIMKEALIKILDYGFNALNLHSVEAHISPENIASATLLERTGFVREAYFKESFHFRGKFLDTAVYSKLKG
jgi:ribosomal-protein-alanine N-acetyltransferase